MVRIPMYIRIRSGQSLVTLATIARLVTLARLGTLAMPGWSPGPCVTEPIGHQANGSLGNDLI